MWLDKSKSIVSGQGWSMWLSNLGVLWLVSAEACDCARAHVLCVVKVEVCGGAGQDVLRMLKLVCGWAG